MGYRACAASASSEAEVGMSSSSQGRKLSEQEQSRRRVVSGAQLTRQPIIPLPRVLSRTDSVTVSHGGTPLVLHTKSNISKITVRFRVQVAGLGMPV